MDRGGAALPVLGRIQYPTNCRPFMTYHGAATETATRSTSSALARRLPAASSRESALSLGLKTEMKPAVNTIAAGVKR